MALFSTAAYAFGPDITGMLDVENKDMNQLLMICAGGFILLLVGSEIIGKKAEAIGAKVAAAVGMFLVAMTGSLPELAVAMHAAFSGDAGFLVSEIIGSNIVNIALILGICALIKPIEIEKGLLKGGMMFIIMLFGSLVVFYDIRIAEGLQFVAASAVGQAQILSGEGVLLLAAFGAFMLGMLVIRSGEKMEDGKGSLLMNLVIILLAGGLVWYAAGICVTSIIEIAKIFSISTVVIGATVVAIGTSLPELSISVLSTIRGKTEVAFGNLAESNVFNIAVIHGIAAFIIPLVVIPQIVRFHIPYMLLTNAIVVLIVANNQISRREGGILIFIYILYVMLLITGGANMISNMFGVA